MTKTRGQRTEPWQTPQRQVRGGIVIAFEMETARGKIRSEPV